MSLENKWLSDIANRSDWILRIAGLWELLQLLYQIVKPFLDVLP